jgi:hypothetical protein
MNINKKRKVDDDYILEKEFRKKLNLTDKETEETFSSRKRKHYGENILENIIKKTTIDNTYLIRKRKDNISNETCDLKIRKIYQCSIHEHNKSICEIYNCDGIHINFVISNIDMYIN